MADPELPSPVSPELLKAGPVPEGKKLAPPESLPINLPVQLSNETHTPITQEESDSVISGRVLEDRSVYHGITSGSPPLSWLDLPNDEPAKKTSFTDIVARKSVGLMSFLNKDKTDVPQIETGSGGNGQPPEMPPIASPTAASDEKSDKKSPADSPPPIPAAASGEGGDGKPPEKPPAAPSAPTEDSPLDKVGSQEDRRLQRRYLSHRMFRPAKSSDDNTSSEPSSPPASSGEPQEPPPAAPPTAASSEGGDGKPPEKPPSAPLSGETPEPERRRELSRNPETLPVSELTSEEVISELSRLDSLDFEVRAQEENEDRISELMLKEMRLSIQDKLYKKNADQYVEEARLQELADEDEGLYGELEELWKLEHSEGKEDEAKTLREKISSREIGAQGVEIYDKLESVKREIEEKKEAAPITDFEKLQSEFSDIDLSLPKNEALPAGKKAQDLEDPPTSDKAKEELETFLYHARELGITVDVGEEITDMFKGYLIKIADPRNNKFEEFSTLKERVQKYTESLKSDDDLSFVIEILNEDRAKEGQPLIDENTFKGIRHIYANRAFEQVKAYDIASKKGKLDKLSEKSLVGDWNIKKEVMHITKSSREAGSNKRLYEETAYQVVLKANNPQEYFDAIDQYVDHLINGTGAFNAQEIINNFKLLEKAINIYGEELGIPKKDQMRKRRAANRRVKLETANYFGIRGLTTPFVSIMESLAEEGTETIAEIAEDPELVLIMKLYESRKFRLRYQRSGHKGHLIGNKDAQDFLGRGFDELMVDTVYNYELAGETKEKKKENAELLAGRLAYANTEEEIFKHFKKISPENLTERELDQRLREISDQVLALRVQFSEAPDIKERINLKEILMESIVKGRELEAIKKKREVTRRKAREARLILDAFGRSAELGAPSFIMYNQVEKRKKTEKGDLIPVDDVIYFLKFAILEEAKKPGKSIDKVCEEIDAYYSDIKTNERKKRTGSQRLTDAERENEYFKAVINLRHNGYTAQINGHKFQDIIDPTNFRYASQVRALSNNFIAIDDNVRDRLMHPEYQKEMKRAGGALFEVPEESRFQTAIYQRIEENARLFKPLDYEQDRQDNLNTAVDSLEKSRRFESQVYRFTHIEFLLKDGEREGERLDFGVSNLPLALKRISYYSAYLHANQREKLTRAADIAAQLPRLTESFNRSISANTMVEALLFAKYGVFDDYEIQRRYEIVNGAARIKTLAEGGVDDKYQRAFGYFEKVVSTITQLYEIWTKSSEHNPLGHTALEATVKHVVNVFKTYQELQVALYAIYDDRRGAAGAGASRYEIGQLDKDFREWLLTEKPATHERDKGGATTYYDGKVIKVYNDPDGAEPRRVFLFDILKWLNETDFDDKGTKLLDEVFRRLNQSHNPSP